MTTSKFSKNHFSHKNEFYYPVGIHIKNAGAHISCKNYSMMKGEFMAKNDILPQNLVYAKKIVKKCDICCSNNNLK